MPPRTQAERHGTIRTTTSISTIPPSAPADGGSMSEAYCRTRPYPSTVSGTVSLPGTIALPRRSHIPYLLNFYRLGRKHRPSGTLTGSPQFHRISIPRHAVAVCRTELGRIRASPPSGTSGHTYHPPFKSHLGLPRAGTDQFKTWIYGTASTVAGTNFVVWQGLMAGYPARRRPRPGDVPGESSRRHQECPRRRSPRACRPNLPTPSARSQRKPGAPGRNRNPRSNPRDRRHLAAANGTATTAQTAVRRRFHQLLQQHRPQSVLPLPGFSSGWPIW